MLYFFVVIYIIRIFVMLKETKYKPFNKKDYENNKSRF